jgi:transposase-like protein
MWCPRCNQGKVVKAKIIKNGNNLFICEECDATWKNKEQLEDNQFEDFSLYMESIGLRGVWSELEILDADE